MLLYTAFRNHTASVPRFPLRRVHFGAGRLDLKDTGWKNDPPLKKTALIHTPDKLFIRKDSYPLNFNPFSSCCLFILSKLIVSLLVCSHSFPLPCFLLIANLSVLRAQISLSSSMLSSSPSFYFPFLKRPFSSSFSSSFSSFFPPNPPVPSYTMQRLFATYSILQHKRLNFVSLFLLAMCLYSSTLQMLFSCVFLGCLENSMHVTSFSLCTQCVR